MAWVFQNIHKAFVAGWGVHQINVGFVLPCSVDIWPITAGPFAVEGEQRQEHAAAHGQ